MKEEEFDVDKRVFMENDFPYALPESTKHYLIWAHKPIPDEMVHVLFKENIPNADGKEYLFFTNPPALQSVKTIHHVHILVRDIQSES